MAIAVGDDTNAVAVIEGIVDDPFEGTPARMHLDGRFDRGIMRDADIGVSTADVGEGDDVFPVPLERRE